MITSTVTIDPVVTTVTVAPVVTTVTVVPVVTTVATEVVTTLVRIVIDEIEIAPPVGYGLGPYGLGPYGGSSLRVLQRQRR
jgi:hypothetical protein